MDSTGISLHHPAWERGMVIILAAGALLIQCIPSLAFSLQWNREVSPAIGAITALTGHLTHWSWSHFTWDIAAFLGLSFAAIALTPGRYAVCLILSAVFIPVEIFLLQPEFATYRGLSGIDSALFGLIIAGLWKSGGLLRWMSAVGFFGFFGKTLYEATTGDTLFVEREVSDFIPVTSAHIVGMICGTVVGFLPKLRLRSNKSECSKLEVER